ncbi:sugar ABC transporter ATP-binding protein [Kineococcus aurantiacus]|uniref:sugar ABC transporter ATP-binding protein n=1 Tax=Kineococcus aurantiacus TaxID=37633 RepID=UPI0031E34E29
MTTTSERAGLSVRGVSKRFGATQALHSIDLDVRPGEVVALLGENGAGKSTLSNIIAGVLASDTGQMTWNGQPHTPTAPRDALDAGIALIHQEMRLLPELSVSENVFVGRQLMKGGRLDRKEMDRRAKEALERLGLDISPRRTVGTLRVAAQQQVEIAKALTLNARLLILDEPTAALGAEETDHLFEQVDALRAQGVSFIYVSHRLEEIARICDRVVVLRDGQWVASHETAQVPVRQLVENMVGRSIDNVFPDLTPPTDHLALQVEELTSTDGSFKDISLTVNRGEIVGIAGIVGAGRTELVRAIAGADPVASGTVSVEGKTLKPGDIRSAIDAGLVLIPEDRKAEGVVLDMSIADNVALANLDSVCSSGGFISPGRVSEVAQEACRTMTVKGRVEQAARTLSGGNQQKVVIAKWLERKPRIVILDEPTRGIDVGARAAIYDVIVGLAAQGIAVIVVSSELDEVLGLSHRVVVLARGTMRGVLDRSEATDVAVMHLAAA